MNRENKRPVTLEDLLQLKRTERPPAEFWTSFERDLRAKQLAALVEKRPWWRTVPRVFAGFSRYHLPLGATAILALTFLSVREYRTVPSALPVTSGKIVAVASEGRVSVPAAVAPASAGVAESAVAPSAVVERLSSAVALAANAYPGSARVVPVVALLDDNPFRSDSPSARSIKANLATAESSLDPLFANRFLGAAHGFEARGLPARPASVEPLAQIALADRRRSRQQAAAMPGVFNTYSINSEKIAGRISNERLRESISRVSASANLVNFKL